MQDAGTGRTPAPAVSQAQAQRSHPFLGSVAAGHVKHTMHLFSVTICIRTDYSILHTPYFIFVHYHRHCCSDRLITESRALPWVMDQHQHVYRVYPYAHFILLRPISPTYLLLLNNIGCRRQIILRINQSRLQFPSSDDDNDAGNY